METLAIKIERCYEWEAMYSGRFKAYDSTQGIEAEWTGDRWRNCGSPLGYGSTISEAIDSLLEQIEGEEVNYKWS